MGNCAKIEKIVRYILDSDYRFVIDANRGKYNNLADRVFLEKKFKCLLGYPLNLNDPKTFNEKLQWLKLYDRRDIYTTLVDKYEAKKCVASMIGEEYIIPTLGVWSCFEDIDFNKLPSSFVLKCTHDSGGLVICKNKENFDEKNAKKKINKYLERNYYWRTREWPYKEVKPRIIAEKYLNAKSLVEYKIFCFNGKPSLFLVCKGSAHGLGRTNDFYDLEFNHIPVIVTYPNSSEVEKKPNEYEKLIRIASILSETIPQVRVDTYVADGKVYFGEMTFFHDSGFCHFSPDSYDLEFGKMINLQENMEH